MRSSTVHRFCRAGSKPSAVRLAASLFVAGLVAGCGSLDRPDLFATGRDARTYNPQTGRYEWPDDAPAKPPGTARRKVAPAERRDAGPDDGRVFNPQTGRFDDTRD